MKALKWRMLAALLAVLTVCLAGVTGCDTFKKDRGEETTVDPSVPPADVGEPYTLFFESNGDGTCVLKKIETNLDYRCDFVLEIPAVSPDGDKVVGIETQGFSLCEYPRIYLDENFKEILKLAKDYYENTEPYKDALVDRKDGVSNFYYEIFKAYWVYISLDNCETEEEKQAMIQAFPAVEKNNIWVMDVSASYFEIALIAKKYHEFAPEYMGYEDDMRQSQAAGSELFHDYTRYGRYIREIRIAEGIEYIEEKSFIGCTRLEKIVLPSTITKIGQDAFDGSGITVLPLPTEIVDVTYNGTVSDWEAVEKEYMSEYDETDVESWINPKYQSFRVHCADGVLEFGIPEEEVTNTPSVPDKEPIEDTEDESFPTQVGGLEYTSNGDGTCYVSSSGGCQDAEIVIPDVSPSGDRVIGVGKEAFRTSNHTLTSIIIPDSVEYLGSLAFAYCGELKSVTIGSGVTNIEGHVFFNCYSLADITVAEGNTKYHSDGKCLIETESKTLLVGCINSKIPTDGSVMIIGEYAFYSRSLMSDITIPDCVQSIGKYAFFKCPYLRRITIGSGVTVIGTQAFDGTQLREVFFNGTMEQWERIEGNWWASATIHCTDGDITPEQ